MLTNLAKKVSTNKYPGIKSVKAIPIIVLIAIFTFIIYFLTSAGNTPYNYFTRLSASFLEGKYYLTDNPPWLSELVPIGIHKFTFVNPPMPAILGIPFIFVFKNDFQQQYLAHLLGALTVAVWGLIVWKLKRDKKFVIWSMLLLGLGSIFWYLSSTGSVWYLGQVASVFFITLAINESLGKRRPLLVSLLLACAFLSRPQTILSVPLFIYLLRDKLKIRNIVYCLIPILSVIFLFGLYNFLRFGSFLNDGRTLIPGILKEPWFSKGLFSLSYIPRHLQILFLMLPKLINKPPFIEPSWAGLAIWITTPAFIFSLFTPFRKFETILFWFSILAIGIVNFSFGSTGFTQFGYRYAVDFYPFLMFLTLMGVRRTGLKWYHWIILVIGIIVNTWGVVWINKFGWVGF